MRAPFAALMILLLINIAVDMYISRQARKRCQNKLWCRVHAYTARIFSLIMVAVIILPAKSGGETELLSKMWLLFGYLSIYIPKYIAIVFDSLAMIPRLWHKQRIKALTKTGVTLACITFVAFWWGALINRFNIQVKEVTVEIPNLPASFDGLTIAQFSDLHLGTYHADPTFVSKLVDRINALNADVIVFTGDIVNRESTEMKPFIATLSRLHAPMGQYAILGNHDYGDYKIWHNEAEKQANMNLLYELFNRTSMKLLRNQTEWLHINNDSIAFIGVENIGDPPFKTYGSLPASYPDLADNNTKILLSHNPQHWVDSISNNAATNVALTLAGHTHAMQMEFANISPATFRYKTWGGLYADSDSLRQLYVNIGVGTVGMPARIGATPEITLITLRRK